MSSAVAPAVRIAGIVTFVCSAAIAPLLPVAVDFGPVALAHADTGTIALSANHGRHFPQAGNPNPRPRPRRAGEQAASPRQAAAGRPVVTGPRNQAGMYGDPAAAAPYWRRQHGPDCGEMAAADVVGQITGNEPTEQQITSVAKTMPGVVGAGPVYRGRAGTPTKDLPVLLAHYGVQSSVEHQSIGGLEQDLAHGHKVIAPVNGPALWNNPGPRDRVTHDVVVTGVDPQAGVVHLNDSAKKTGSDEQVPLAAFEQAWAASQNLAVVTH